MVIKYLLSTYSVFKGTKVSLVQAVFYDKRQLKGVGRFEMVASEGMQVFIVMGVIVLFGLSQL